jgi:hypothetical protein
MGYLPVFLRDGQREGAFTNIWAGSGESFHCGGCYSVRSSVAMVELLSPGNREEKEHTKDHFS